MGEPNSAHVEVAQKAVKANSSADKVSSHGQFVAEARNVEQKVRP